MLCPDSQTVNKILIDALLIDKKIPQSPLHVACEQHFLHGGNDDDAQKRVIKNENELSSALEMMKCRGMH